MKILVLSNLYPPDVIGGYELGCRQVVDALRARGHDVRVLTSAPRTPVPSSPHVRRTLRLTDVWSDYLFRKSVPITSALAQAESHRVNAANVHALLVELEEFRPDVVYVWMLVGIGGLGLMAALQYLRVPWAWHLMDDVPVLLCMASGRLVPTFVREFTTQLRGTYLACSRQILEEIEASGFALGDDVEIVPNWVDGPIGPPRSSYIKGGRLRIVSAAGQVNLRGDKGLDLIVEAAALLRDRGETLYSVDIYGTVVDESVPDLIRTHGVENLVNLRGPRSQAELSTLYAGYDLFAFPTHPREPFAFAPLEAAARGCVPVMSFVCGNAEWFVHGVHVLKVPRTAAAFADVFAAVRSRAIDLARVGRRAAAVVRRDFHLDSVLPRIEAILDRAAARPRAGAGKAAEVYHLAVLAERLTRVILQESRCA